MRSHLVLEVVIEEKDRHLSMSSSFSPIFSILWFMFSKLHHPVPLKTKFIALFWYMMFRKSEFGLLFVLFNAFVVTAIFKKVLWIWGVWIWIITVSCAKPFILSPTSPSIRKYFEISSDLLQSSALFFNNFLRPLNESLSFPQTIFSPFLRVVSSLFICHHL